MRRTGTAAVDERRCRCGFCRRHPRAAGPTASGRSSWARRSSRGAGVMQGVAVMSDGDSLRPRWRARLRSRPGLQVSELLVAASGPAGVTQFLVPADAPGVTVTPLETIDLARRFASVRFDGVRVDGVGGARRGRRCGTLRRAASSVPPSCCSAPKSVGALDHVFTSTVEYLGDRYSFGRSLSSYQALEAPARRHEALARERPRGDHTRRARGAGRRRRRRRARARGGGVRRRRTAPRSCTRRCNSTAASASRGSTSCTCTCDG